MPEFTNPCAASEVYVDNETARMTALPGCTGVLTECPSCKRMVSVVGVGRDARYEHHAIPAPAATLAGAEA
jgi:hypothetical protein